jgi:hypothetical protein
VAFSFVLAASLCACNPKPNTNPTQTFNSLSARVSRVATIYTPTALDALPLLAAELKWTQAKVESAKAELITIRDTAAAVAKALGSIADSAITADQKILIGPLLTVIATGVEELDKLGLFGGSESVSKLETGVRVAILTLRIVGRLLPQFPAN